MEFFSAPRRCTERRERTDIRQALMLPINAECYRMKVLVVHERGRSFFSRRPNATATVERTTTGNSHPWRRQIPVYFESREMAFHGWNAVKSDEDVKWGKNNALKHTRCIDPRREEQKQIEAQMIVDTVSWTTTTTRSGTSPGMPPSERTNLLASSCFITTI